MNIERPIVKKDKLIEEEIVRLDNNQAPYGPYKDYPYTYPMYKTLTDKYNCRKDNLLLTRGAEEALRNCYRTFTSANKSKVLRMFPSFGMLEVFEDEFNILPIKIRYDEDLNKESYAELLVDHIEKYSDELAFCLLILPDNPTGFMPTLKEFYPVYQAAKENNVTLVLDLTYYDYYLWSDLGVNFLHYMNQTLEENVVLINSFSKSHGLAGIRLGCIRSSKENIDLLRQYRPMQEVNSVACSEAVINEIRFGGDCTYNLHQVNEWRREFKKLDYARVTYANFVLLKVGEENKEIIRKELLENYLIAIRTEFDCDIMKDWIRVSIGLDCYMRQVIHVVTGVMN